MSSSTSSDVRAAARTGEWLVANAWRAASWVIARTTTHRQLLHQNAEHEHQNPCHDEPVRWAGRTVMYASGRRAGWACRYGFRVGWLDVGLVLSRTPPPAPTAAGLLLCDHSIRIGSDDADVTHVLTRSMSPPEVCPVGVMQAVAHRKLLYARLMAKNRDGDRLSVDITRWLNARLASFVPDAPWFCSATPTDFVSLLIATGALTDAWVDASDVELSLLDGHLSEASLGSFDAVRWPVAG